MRLLSIIFLAAAFLFCELSAWSFFRSSSNNRNFPHDMKTHSALNNLYNQRVVEAERVKRPIFNGFLQRVIPISHSGARVTLEDGSKYLIHKGNNYGLSSQTVVVDANRMSNRWKVEDTKPVQGKTVGDFVKAGGRNYNLLLDNCHHGSKRMMRQ